VANRPTDAVRQTVVPFLVSANWTRVPRDPRIEIPIWLRNLVANIATSPGRNAICSGYDIGFIAEGPKHRKKDIPFRYEVLEAESGSTFLMLE
jgi:hypothetical protein